MDNTKLAQQLFERWKSTLAKKSSKERETNAAQSNFEELFYELSLNNIDFETAEGLLSQIISAHMPSFIIVEKVWQLQRSKRPGLNKKDWLAHWRAMIEESAKAAFYNWYKIPGEEEASKLETGPMSTQEYSAQRKHAETFTILTAKELRDLDEKRRKFMEEEDNDLIFNV